MNPAIPPKHPGIAERLEAFVAEKADNPRQFALAAGLTPQVISHLLQGKAVPSGDTLTALVTKWPTLNTTWLLTGRGTMYIDGSTAQLPPAIPSEAKPQREGFPATPGTATPQEADFVGKVIRSLEQQIEAQRATIEWQQEQLGVLIKKPEASAEAAPLTTTVDDIAAERLPLVEMPTIQRYKPRKPAQRPVIAGFHLRVA